MGFLKLSKPFSCQKGENNELTYCCITSADPLSQSEGKILAGEPQA